MQTLKPLLKTLYVILVVMILLHAVLSFCGCVVVESGNRFPNDLHTEPHRETKDLLGVLVLFAALGRIALMLPRKKIFHIIGFLLSLQVAIITSSYVWVQDNLVGSFTGLTWTSYVLTALGQWAIGLSWVITVFHAVIAVLLCKPEGGRAVNRAKVIALCIVVLIVVLLLVIFRDIISDWINDMFRGLYC